MAGVRVISDLILQVLISSIASGDQFVLRVIVTSLAVIIVMLVSFLAVLAVLMALCRS